MQTIAPTSVLPGIFTPTVIDATTQHGYAGTPLIQLTGTYASASNLPGSGLTIGGKGGTTIKGFIINSWAFPYSGINIITSNNTIQGNYIGTDPTGTAPKPNGSGVNIAGFSPGAANGNVIGGTTPAARNVITSNDTIGVAIDGTAGSADGNVVLGNYIGLNAAGTDFIKNPKNVGSNRTGVDINKGNNNTIGGTAPGARNIISGNRYGSDDGGAGVFIEGKQGVATGNKVIGNYIGTDVTGRYAVVNNAGVYIDTASNNIIGGPTPAERNIISGSHTIGMTVDGSSADATGNSATGNKILGNYIGTDVTGTVAVPNNVGLDIAAANSNFVGGTNPGEGNLISGNANSGIAIEAERDTTFTLGTASNNVFQGNLIGTNAAGNAAVPNQFGIAIAGGTNNIIGGTTAAARNIIYGFTNTGILAYPAPRQASSVASGNIIKGNYIGTYDPSVTLPPSGQSGILFDKQLNVGADGNIVGGTGPGDANVIAFSQYGVLVTNGSHNDLISGNSIYGQTVKGISLVNGNDSQAKPTITTAQVTGANQVTVNGALNATNPNRTFQIEFFASPVQNPPQGKAFVGSVQIQTDPTGNVGLNVPLSGVHIASIGRYLTATAIDTTNGDTSEFSTPIAITFGPVAGLAPNPGTTPQHVVIGNAFAPLAITVQDADGNPLSTSGIQVTFTAPTSGPSGTFPGGATSVTVTTDANGVATAPTFITNNIAGPYQVTATIAGIRTSATFFLTNNANPLPSPHPNGGAGGSPNALPSGRTPGATQGSPDVLPPRR